MSWPRRRFEKYKPKIHYGFSRSLCLIENSGSRNRKLSKDINEVTCKMCLKKYKKGSWIVEHFPEETDLFTI